MHVTEWVEIESASSNPVISSALVETGSSANAEEPHEHIVS